MRLDRFSILLGALCLASAVAIGGYVLGARLPSPFAAADAPSAEGETDATTAADTAGAATAPDDFTAESCLDYPEAGDPRTDPAIRAYYRDDLEAVELKDSGFASNFVDGCTIVAGQEKDRDRADRIRYAVARFQDILHRDQATQETLAAIAPRYPAAAYMLATLLSRQSLGDVGSAAFMRAYDLLQGADRGGDKRARRPLLDMTAQLYPLDEFNLPTLLAGILSGKFAMIPDSVATRMAVHSLWEGYRARCEAWEIIRITPQDDAAMKNFIMPVQIAKVVDLIQQVPTMAGRMKDWGNNIGGLTLPEIIRDFNTGKAYPAQILFVIDTAGSRDGSRAYDKFTCSGPRAERLQTNMLRLLRDRSLQTDVVDTQASDLERLATMPDYAVLL